MVESCIITGIIENLEADVQKQIKLNKNDKEFYENQCKLNVGIN